MQLLRAGQTQTFHAASAQEHVVCLQLPATAITDVSTASLVLQNGTSQAQTFEFGIPGQSDLTLSPHVGSLPAGASMRVLLRYCPRADRDPPCPGAQPGVPWSPLDANQLPGSSNDAAGDEAAGDEASSIVGLLILMCSTSLY